MFFSNCHGAVVMLQSFLMEELNKMHTTNLQPNI